MPSATKPRNPKTTRSRNPAGSGDGPAVLVVGTHPAAWLCALLLHDAKVNVAVTESGTPSLDRLVTLNPMLFKLHKSLEPLKDLLGATPISHARFIGQDGNDATSKATATDAAPLTLVMRASALRERLRQLALDAGVRLCEGVFSVEDVDERGAHVRVGRQRILPRIIAICDAIEGDLAAKLDIEPFARSQLWTLATAGLTARGHSVSGSQLVEDVLPVSLELQGPEAWGWLMQHDQALELSVVYRSEGGDDQARALLDAWAVMLRERKLLGPEATPDGRTFQTHPMPLAGALERDVVGRRTLLFGPAGGFLSASGEEMYPACWSAKFAADAASKATRASHPQDALAAYRGQWGSTLGDYLRGPQQNLQFLMPLVYRNPPMTDRLAEAILKGRSLVK